MSWLPGRLDLIAGVSHTPRVIGGAERLLLPVGLSPLVRRFRPAQFQCAMPTIILVLLSIFLPPLAVWLKSKSGKQTIINVILCFFFWIPAVLHALYVVLAK
jgi:uncharacterized membrane protein YqaE (UPF0057 family)